MTKEIIGNGKIGTIFRATWHTPGGEKTIAFKKYTVQTRSENWLAKLNLEMKRLCKIEHPNLVRIYGAMEKIGNIGIAMELLDCTLHQAVITERRPFPEKKRFTFVRQISEALKYLHNSTIVHSNLTSKNIFLSLHNIAKIGNYGPKLVRSTMC